MTLAPIQCNKLFMDINVYIKQKGLTLADAADELEVTRQALSLWCKGKRIPRLEQMARITKWSKGAVIAQDFYGDT